MAKLKAVDAATAAPTEQKPKRVPDLVVEQIEIPLVSTSPLLMNRFSNKAIEMIRTKQAGTGKGGTVKQAREPKDPKACFQSSLHVISGDAGEKGAVYGIPSVAFKGAVVECGVDEGWRKTQLRRAFFVEGELVPLEYTKLKPVEHWTRVKMGGVDLRYRGEFESWRAKPLVTFRPQLISIEDLIYLFNCAGFSNGVGDWRPQRDGSYGRFKVAKAKEWESWK